MTSGLPDDSRGAEERAAERRLRELRGRVKTARAVTAGAPGLAEALRSDWQCAARFYVRFGVTEGQVRHGLPATTIASEDLAERVGSPSDWMAEVRERAEAVLPGSGLDDE